MSEMTGHIVTPVELRAVRLRKGVTQTRIADRIGVDKTRVSRIESGRQPLARLDDRQLDQWARLLDISPSRMPRTDTGRVTPMRRLRLRRGWTCAELARRAGVSYRNIREYDAGRRPMRTMTAGTLLKVADALDSSMEALCSLPDCTRTVPPPDAGWTGTPLAWYRHGADVSQARLAAMSGRTSQQITGIETRRWNTRDMRAGSIIDIAMALDIPAANLIETDDDNTGEQGEEK
ncbi:XRE family transcriptional regulator [Bifidobacterium rousetti]|uniref:helix-turn-helix domain-containing protein n=1 Tax=Bifidobacterium rousetti TaxID=2045439 RepID=UPI00123C2370|nr:helix-turn-helix transcriptional regulator [Bifidobacterium rousetti]KAA8815708.1 XRE family transcriptional regulator [Bifidobacterium rousetti]